MNENNLIKPQNLTPSERRENASKAGKASGQARRKKRDMKTKMKMLLEMPCQNCEDFNSVSELGIDIGDIDNEMVMLVRQGKHRSKISKILLQSKRQNFLN